MGSSWVLWRLVMFGTEQLFIIGATPNIIDITGGSPGTFGVTPGDPQGIPEEPEDSWDIWGDPQSTPGPGAFLGLRGGPYPTLPDRGDGIPQADPSGEFPTIIP